MSKFRLTRTIYPSKWQMIIFVTIINFKYNENIQTRFHLSDVKLPKYKEMAMLVQPLFGNLGDIKEYERTIQGTLNEMVNKYGYLDRILNSGIYWLTEKGCQEAHTAYKDFIDTFTDPEILFDGLDSKILKGKSIDYPDTFKNIEYVYQVLVSLQFIDKRSAENALLIIRKRLGHWTGNSDDERIAITERQLQIFDDNRTLFEKLKVKRSFFEKQAADAKRKKYTSKT